MTNLNTPPPPAPPGMAIADKPPRPAVTFGAALMIAGGALMVVGSFLNWFKFDTDSYSGFSNGKDGPTFAVLGGLAVVFGIVQLTSKKVLALGILGVVTSAFGLLAAVADYSDVKDAVDAIKAFGVEATTGPGLYVVMLGAVVAVVGSIATIAQRRA